VELLAFRPPINGPRADTGKSCRIIDGDHLGSLVAIAAPGHDGELALAQEN
jgi:hypothetical protein